MHIKFYFILFLSIFLSKSLNANVENFRFFGDVFKFLPLYTMGVSFFSKDYEGFKQLLYGAVSTQLTIELIKRGFEFSAKNGYPVNFSFRPDGSGDPKGMPSGHSGGAFSAAGYVFYRYGFKSSIPFIIIATAVASSRVVAKKHTIPQVIVGASIAWSFAYIFTDSHNLVVYPVAEFDYKYKFFAINLNFKF